MDAAIADPALTSFLLQRIDSHESFNHALQQTRREARGCNRCVPCAGSLSLGRSRAAGEVEPSGASLEAHPKPGASWEDVALEQVLSATGDRGACFWSTHSGPELDFPVLWHGKRVEGVAPSG
jgi:hypothetical protein